MRELAAAVGSDVILHGVDRKHEIECLDFLVAIESDDKTDRCVADRVY